MREVRWQDVANAAIGAWLLVCPWVLGIGDEEFAEAWNAYALGGAILLVSALALPLPHMWEEIINVVLGTWLILSPWTLEFSRHFAVAANAVIAGALVVALAAWAIGGGGNFGRWRRERHAAP